MCARLANTTLTFCLLLRSGHGPLHSLPLRYDLGSVHSTSSRLTRKDRTRIHSHKPRDQGEKTLRTYRPCTVTRRASYVHAPGRRGYCTPKSYHILHFTQQIVILQSTTIPCSTIPHRLNSYRTSKHNSAAHLILPCLLGRQFP